MKTLIFILALLATPAWATQYYVANAGSDSNNGTSTGTPWQTIAHVDAQTFSPGDTINFNCGDTWHETYLPPSSGAAGNLINWFGRYGACTGTNDPILTGADVVGGGGWTQQALAPIDTQNFVTAALNGAFWSNTNCTFPSSPVYSGFNFSLQCAKGGAASIRAGTLGNNFYEIDSYFQISSTTATSGQFTRVFFAEGSGWNGANGVGAWVSYNGTNYQLNICQGGHTGCASASNITVGTWYTLRWLISANSGGASDYSQLYINGSLGPSSTGLTLTGAVADMSVGGEGAYNDVYTENFDGILTYNQNSTGASNIWYTSVAWQPYCAIFNETQNYATLAPQSSIGAVSSANKWYWAANVLYAYSTSSPASAYTSPGIQACHRQYVFTRSNQNYGQITAGVFEGSNVTSLSQPGNIFIGQTGPNDSGESTGWQIGGVEVRYSSGDAAWLDSVSGTFSNSSSHDNIGMCFDFDTGANMTATNLTASYCSWGTYPGSVGSSLPNFTLDNFRCTAGIANNCIVLSKGTNYTIKNSDLSGSVYNGFYCDGTTVTGVLIKGTRIHGNATGAWIAASGCTNIVFDYDLFWGNTTANFENLSGNSSVSLLNSVLDTGGTGIWVTGSGSGLTAANNITTNNTVEMQVDSSASGSFALNYNDYYHSAGGTSYMNWKGTASNFTSWQTNSSQDANSKAVNPLYNAGTNVYTLQTTSPMIGVGTNLGTQYSIGLLPASAWPAGVVYAPQNALWNIGAYVTPGGINPFWFSIP